MLRSISNIEITCSREATLGIGYNFLQCSFAQRLEGILVFLDCLFLYTVPKASVYPRTLEKKKSHASLIPRSWLIESWKWFIPSWLMKCTSFFNTWIILICLFEKPLEPISSQWLSQKLPGSHNCAESFANTWLFVLKLYEADEYIFVFKGRKRSICSRSQWTSAAVPGT